MKTKVKPRKAKPQHDHAQCVAAALREAEDLCRRRGINLTLVRRRVLELVWQGHEPVKAYDIIDNFHSAKHVTRPPTVYRALSFLIENGLIHRIESQNAYVGCVHPIVHHDANFFICNRCQRVTEIDSGELDAPLEKLARKNAFKINQKTIEIYGLCQICSAREKPTARQMT